MRVMSSSDAEPWAEQVSPPSRVRASTTRVMQVIEDGGGRGWGYPHSPSAGPDPSAGAADHDGSVHAMVAGATRLPCGRARPRYPSGDGRGRRL